MNGCDTGDNDVVAGAVMVTIPISPGEKAKKSGAGSIVSPLGVDVSLSPPIVAADIA